MVATVQTGTLSGVEAVGVAVEVAQTRGLPGFEKYGSEHVITSARCRGIGEEAEGTDCAVSAVPRPR
jgi:hypothetical protein